jgi:RNA polymerase sigma-70 factor (ECF subfamily)
MKGAEAPDTISHWDGTQPRSDMRWPNVSSVHEKYADFVWDALRRLGVGEADRDDLRQDVFIIVHERLPTFRREEPLPPWLFGICRNVASVHRRRAYVRRETPCEQMPEIGAECETQSPEEVARRREAERTLAAILDGLDLDKRAVLIMFEIHEMSLREIAAALGVPAGTVSSRLYAARRAFGDALDRHRSRVTLCD